MGGGGGGCGGAAGRALVSQGVGGWRTEKGEADKGQEIRSAINVEVAGKEAGAKYKEVVEEALLVKADGQQVPGNAVALDIVKIKETKTYPVFVADVNGQTKYIMAMYGAGLWGPIWGYISVDSDKNTVYGADFSHQGETPGLGAEISKPAFCNEFKGKRLFVDGIFKSIAVVKLGKSVDGQDYVDGVSRVTVTSNGVGAMLFDSQVV